jgi:hypothetical protein
MTLPTHTLEQVHKPTTKTAGLWLVKVNGNIVGQLERFKNSRTDTHPWKAFKGTGMTRHYLGAFYIEGEVPQDGHTTFGGKQAALEAIFKS